jgi:RecB family exonuclease
MDQGNGFADEEGVTLLSASSIQTFLRCGKQWYYAYILGIKSPPSLKQLLGTSGHEALATNYLQKMDTLIDLPVDQVVASFSDRWDRGADDALVEDDEKPGEIKDSGVRAVELYHEQVSPTVMPVWVEQPVQFTVNNVPYSGYVDLVDHLDRVRDHKFVSRKPDGQQYMLNMTGYAIAYRHMTGRTETDVILDAVVRYKKGPEHRPVAAGGPVSDHAIAVFASIVGTVSEQITQGRFLPNGLVGTPPACSWCGYADICDDLRASRVYNERDTLSLALERVDPSNVIQLQAARAARETRRGDG